VSDMKWDEIANSYSWKRAMDYFSNKENDYTKEELHDAFLHMSELYLSELVNGLVLEDYILGDKDEKEMEKIFSDNPRFEEMDAKRFDEPDVTKRIKIIENYLEQPFSFPEE